MTLNKMEDGLNIEDNTSNKMGASSNPNPSRLTILQARKKTLEETITKRNQELRQLCIQEAELTGVMPPEIPLEPGESPPSIRRKVYTHYQLPQNLIDNLSKEEESISELELALQVQAKLAEAALGLANESNITKTVRRQHMHQYQQHKQQYNALKEKLDFLKTRGQIAKQQTPSPSQQQKQKKKPRPIEQEDSVSMQVNMTEPFGKPTLRHSMRSLQHTNFNSNTLDNRYVNHHQRLTYQHSEGSALLDNRPYLRQEDILTNGIYRLDLNGYNNYVERQETMVVENQMKQHQYNCSQSSPNLHQQMYQHSPTGTHNFQQIPQRTAQSVMSPGSYSTISSHYSHSGNSQHHQHMMHQYNKYNMNMANHHSAQMQRQSSPNVNNSSNNNLRVQNYPSHPIHNQPHYRPHSTLEPTFQNMNPHQIQPHQQYEHDVMTSGLGGFWKRTETGELVWFNNAPQADSSWQRSKRFGSLDRRKNKRIHKRNSPNVDPKCATISSTHVYSENVSLVPAKTPQTDGYTRADSRQLIRTQSLGSVGAHIVDNVWPSDDNSSCDSEAPSIAENNTALLKKPKQKEWYETSLDGPAIATRSYSTIPIAPEEKYVEPINLTPPPQPPKPVLEIPAESNPSPRVQETNMEIFNNNIPKNCTIVQAAQWKPYHEETKPFEMSDFYKYSTKYKKKMTPDSKPPENEGMRARSQSVGFKHLPSPQGQSRHNSLSESQDDDNASVVSKGIYQPLQPMQCQPYSPSSSTNQSIASVGSPTSLNASLNLSQLTSNVAENFSAEMNAWYKNKEHQTGNNNTSTQIQNPRSTATLV